jgi:hypothetical protein
MHTFANEIKEPLNGEKAFARVAWAENRFYFILPSDAEKRTKLIDSWKERIKPFNGTLQFYPLNDEVMDVLVNHDKLRKHSLPFYYKLEKKACERCDDLNAVILQ